MQQATGQPSPPSVLVVTADAGLGERLARLAAAVGVSVTTAADTARAGGGWLDAPLVLLDAEAAGMGVPVRRGGVVLVQGAGGDERVWRSAVQVGAEAVARLPHDESWLLERLAMALDAAAPPARAVGVVGGRGGAGASTLAAALAREGVRRGRDVVLVDADPAGGGIDLLLTTRYEPGLRWGDLVDVRGVLRGSVLRDGLPVCAGLRVLTWEREDACDVPAEPMEAVLDAARRSHDLVVVDLPRREDAATVAVLWRLDLLLVVAPAEMRAAAGAAYVVRRFGRHVGDVRLVVRGPAPIGLSAEGVADGAGLPWAYRWAYEPGLPAAGERAQLPDGRRSPTVRLMRRLLEEIGVAGRPGARGHGRPPGSTLPAGAVT